MSTLSHEPCTQTPDLFAPLTEAEQTSAPVNMSAFKEEWEPVVPAPSEPEMPSGAQAIWVYRNAEGRPLFARFRYDGANQSGATTKEVRPLTYGRRVWVDKHNRQHDVTGWHWKQPAKPLPLYGLDRLAAHPDAPVLLVEGEKATDAGALLFPDLLLYPLAVARLPQVPMGRPCLAGMSRSGLTMTNRGRNMPKLLLKRPAMLERVPYGR